MIPITKTNEVLKNSSKLWCKTSSTQQYYYIFTGQNSCDFHTYNVEIHASYISVFVVNGFWFVVKWWFLFYLVFTSSHDNFWSSNVWYLLKQVSFYKTFINFKLLRMHLFQLKMSMSKLSEVILSKYNPKKS